MSVVMAKPVVSHDHNYCLRSNGGRSSDTEVFKNFICQNNYVNQKQESCCDGHADKCQIYFDKGPCNFFQHYPKVTCINLSRKCLKNVHKHYFDDAFHLTYIILSGNEIEDLESETFSQLTNLATVDLSCNKLKNLPNLIFSKNINLLNFSQNYLENFDSRTLTTTQLSTLDLSNNKLCHLGDYTFNNTRELLYLNLSRNSLTEIDKFAFNTTHKLSWLDLSSNNLKEIDKNLFLKLSNLAYLNLENNELAFLDKHTFISQKKLKVLILRSNYLRDIDVSVLKNSNFLEYFDVSENPLDCSCELNTSVENLKQGTHVGHINVVLPCNTLTACEETQTSYLYPEKEDPNEEGHGERNMKGEEENVTYWVVIVGIMFLCLISGSAFTIICMRCWKHLKPTTEGREIIIDTTYSSADESLYYTSVIMSGDNETTPPDVPDRPSEKTINVSRGRGLTSENLAADDRNNYRTTKNSNDLPKEVTVVNDLYK